MRSASHCAAVSVALCCAQLVGIVSGGSVSGSAALGLDVGSSNSVVAVARHGGIEVLVNEASRRSTPSLVGFDARRRLVGTAAETLQATSPESCASRVKSLLGSGCGAASVQLPHKGQPRSFSATQLLAMLLRHLYAGAERQLEGPPLECTIAVPLHYDAPRRRAVLDAAELAGIGGARLISEGAAIALDYGLGRHDLPADVDRHVAFVDAGESGVQVCIARFRRDGVTILSHAHAADAGGEVARRSPAAPHSTLAPPRHPAQRACPSPRPPPHRAPRRTPPVPAAEDDSHTIPRSVPTLTREGPLAARPRRLGETHAD